MFNKTWDLIECVFVEISSKKNVIIFFILIMFIPFLISVIAKKNLFFELSTHLKTDYDCLSVE